MITEEAEVRIAGMMLFTSLAMLSSISAADAQDADARRHPPAISLITRQVCPLPEVPADAELLIFGVYDGQAILSAWIGSADEETNLTEVDVEPGQSKLYVILTSYESMVWRFHGATDRIARVVVSSYAAAPPVRTTQTSARDDVERPSASGVMGIPDGNVTIANANCWDQFSNPGDMRAKQVAATIAQTSNRNVHALFARYSAQRIALPSGTATDAIRDSAVAPKGFDEYMWQEARRFWPAGLIFVDPDKIVATAEVKPYEVLPSQMGLAHLIAAGAIEGLRNGRFRIVRRIAHLPSGMGGAHSAVFQLAKGVPLPPGDPVHSCIISEKTGEALTPGPNCPRNR